MASWDLPAQHSEAAGRTLTAGASGPALPPGLARETAAVGAVAGLRHSSLGVSLSACSIVSEPKPRRMSSDHSR